MAKNEIEGWLVERTENIIAKEQLEVVIRSLSSQFEFEREAIDLLIDFKQQVV